MSCPETCSKYAFQNAENTDLKQRGRKTTWIEDLNHFLSATSITIT